MGTRGRKSAAELSTAPIIEVIPRPAAPDHLTDAEAQIWESYVSGVAGDYFRKADFDTLANLCRHTYAVRRISQWLEKALDDPETGIEDIDRLMRMRQRETAQANALARSLRLTKQASVSPKGAGTATLRGSARHLWERQWDGDAPLQKPWEIAAPEETDDGTEG